jgi:hypothetical protein
MVRKKNAGRRSQPPRKAEQPEAVLVRDASEVRALIERAQHLLQGGATEEPVAPAPSEVAREEVDAPLPDPAALVSPRPVMYASIEQDSQDPEEPEVSEVPLDALPEAFLTTTMGTMLLTQGRPADARAVFERVLERSPHDAEAQRGLGRALAALGATGAPSSAGLLRARILRPTQPVLVASEPQDREPDGLLEREDPPWSYDIDELRALPVDPTTIVAFWEVREHTLRALANARGVRGDLLLRVVSITAGEDSAPERVERLEGPIGRIGDWFVWGLTPGARHEVSLGVADSAGFHEVLVAPAIQTPRGAPSRTRAVVRARLVLPERKAIAATAAPRIASVVGPASVIEALREARATRALEGAELLSERPIAAAGSAAPPAGSEEAQALVPHWSEAVDEGRDVPSVSPSDDASLEVEVVRVPVGSSWGVAFAAARRELPSSR